MNIFEAMNKHTYENPNKVALKETDIIITYEQLQTKINQTINAFKTAGAKQGDRILIQIGNRSEFIYCFLAAMKMEAIIVPINPEYTANEISFIVEDCHPRIYVCEQISRSNVSTVKELSSNLTQVFLLDDPDEALNFKKAITAESEEHIPFSGDDYSVCQILYTSGTTGRPKGAMLTHDGLAGNAKTYSEILECNQNDIALIVAPLYHASSQTNCLLTMLISGATCFIMPKFSPGPVIRTLEEEQITYFFGAPTMYTIILNNELINDCKFNLRIAFTGSAAMPVTIHERWYDLFGFNILEGYGLSECSPIVTNHRPGEPIKIGSIGRALPGVKVKIFDENDQEVPIGKKGEVVVQGPNVMKGYWNKPEETERALRKGWFHTGDIGIEDEDGYFYIVDRQKNMINRGGINIYPREIEEVLYQYESFLEVGVVGEADEVMGENVVAYVTLKNPSDADKLGDFQDVKDFCKEKLATYKIPQRFYILDELPKTLSGKIRKIDL